MRSVLRRDGLRPRLAAGSCLEGSRRASSTATRALYYLYVLAVLILALEAEVDPALVAGVGYLLVGGNGDILWGASLA